MCIRDRPIIYRSGSLLQTEDDIQHSLERSADLFANQMLRMPSEKLSTSAGLAVVSEEFKVVADPIDGRVFQSPSIEFITRLKSYLRGGT
jgi:hypothetical protein